MSSIITLHLIFETWSLPGPGPLPFWLGWLASETQRFFYLAYPPALGLWMLQYLISVGAGDLNSGLDSWTLPVVSSPHPLCYGTFLDSLFIISAEVVFCLFV